jgi:hypothetical protein
MVKYISNDVDASGYATRVIIKKVVSTESVCSFEYNKL